MYTGVSLYRATGVAGQGVRDVSGSERGPAAWAQAEGVFQPFVARFASLCRLASGTAGCLHTAQRMARRTVLMPETGVSRSCGARFDSVGRL